MKKLTDLETPWAGDHLSRLEEIGLPSELDGESLGTIGGGNHFAEFQRVDSIVNEAVFCEHGFDAERVLLLVHSGSRGLGQAILQEHIHRLNTQGLDVASKAFQNYRSQHDQAMRWAELNRDIIAERFLCRLGAQAGRKLDVFHNSVTHHEDGWLHRKGVAPADKGLVVVPGSRGTMTYLVSPKVAEADVALHSLAHGAGRKWARGDAKAKLKKRFKISDLERTDLGGRVICEDRNLIFEEAPQAYKNIESVVDDLVQAGLIEVVAILRPIITYKTRHK